MSEAIEEEGSQSFGVVDTTTITTLEKEIPSREQILTDGPIILMSRDKFGIEETKEHLITIHAYNVITFGRQLAFQSHMLPLKKNEQVSKFYPLSIDELRECSEKGKELGGKILYIETEARKAAKVSEKSEVVPDIPEDTDVLKIFLDAFHVNSVPLDDEIATWILLAYMGTRELNGDGLHLKLGAEQGSGKSLTVNAGLHALPEAAFYKGAFTDKSLVYDKTLEPGKIIKLDEMKNNSEAFENLLKECVSSYQSGTNYRTVVDGKDGKETKMIPIPGRLSFILLSVDNYGDEQTLSRYVPLSIFPRGTESIKITDFRLDKRRKGQSKLYTDETVKKSRLVLSHFQGKTFRVTIPFAKNISYNITDQRVQEWFENAIMYSAVMRYKQRKHEGNIFNTEISVEASKEDFDFCTKLSLFQKKDNAVYRFGPSEIELIRKLKEHNLTGQIVLKKKLIEISGKSGTRISQIMNGREDRGNNGLISKLGITEVSMTQKTTKYDGITTVDANNTSEKGYTIPNVLPDVDNVNNSIVSWKEKEKEKEEKPDQLFHEF